MKLSNREFMLGWLTMVIVLGGLTYWLGQSKVEEWKKTFEDREELKRRVVKAERILEQRTEWEEKFNGKMSELPQHPVGKDVTAELLKTLEQTAQDHGLILLRREPRPEEGLGDLYQVSINCTWEGELKALTHFLYAIHTKGVILDVRQLSVSPVQGQTGRLKGGFTVDCAYTRLASGT